MGGWHCEVTKVVPAGAAAAAELLDDCVMNVEAGVWKDDEEAWNWAGITTWGGSGNAKSGIWRESKGVYN